jgi:trans-aconitate 2-methyltransferase
MFREWDAAAYDALPLPHLRWGRRTLGRLDLAGDETVLEAGCGTGRDTEALLDLLPKGRVVAVDASASMLDRLRARLDGRLDRVDVIQADLTRPLPIDIEVDAVSSVATFHWIHDHDAVFGNIAAVLRPSGRFAVDCGGAGNVAAVRTAVHDVLGEPADDMWHFAGVDDTRARLERAGFTDVDVDLVPDPARLEPGEQFHGYLATVVLGAHLKRMAQEERQEFVEAVAARLDEPVVDYVRLVCTATRAD